MSSARNRDRAVAERRKPSALALGVCGVVTVAALYTGLFDDSPVLALLGLFGAAALGLGLWRRFGRP